jgi:hypothetical protein
MNTTDPSSVGHNDYFDVHQMEDMKGMGSNLFRNSKAVYKN